MTDSNNEAPHSNTASSGQGLMPLVKSMSAAEAAALLTQHPASTIAGVLVELNPALTQDILAALPSALADEVFGAVPSRTASQWRFNQKFAEGTIGRMMEPVVAVFAPEMTVAQTVEELRTLVKTAFITYGYVVDFTGKLLGVITMRDLLFSADDARLNTLLLRSAFALTPDLPLADAMKLVDRKSTRLNCSHDQHAALPISCAPCCFLPTTRGSTR